MPIPLPTINKLRHPNQFNKIFDGAVQPGKLPPFNNMAKLLFALMVGGLLGAAADKYYMPLRAAMERRFRA